MTTAERNERRRLHNLWAAKKATVTQILRCMALDRKANTEVRARAMHDAAFSVERIAELTGLTCKQVAALIRAQGVQG